MRRGLAIAAILVLGYFGAAAVLFRYGMESVMFPAAVDETFASDEVIEIHGAHANSMLLRRYGNATAEWIVFSPDRTASPVDRRSRKFKP